MPTHKQQVEDTLAVRDSVDLRAILDFAQVPARGASTPRELAKRITSQLWWTYATPLGLAARTITLDEIVDHIAKRLQVQGPIAAEPDAWSKLQHMTGLLVRSAHTGVALDDLDPQARDRLVRSWWPTIGFATGAGGGFGALGAGKGVLWVAGTRIGRWLPYIPSVGSWARGAYKAGGIAVILGGPVGVAMTALAANDALGTNYPRLVPLLLGVGSLGPTRVDEAEVIP